MRKATAIVLICFMMTAAGCRSKDKVTVIKGPGTANSSHMISFNQFCPGRVEGFTGKELIVSQLTGDTMEFYRVDTVTKEKDLLLSTPQKDNYCFMISNDGKKFLYDSYLVDIGNKKSVNLPVQKEKALSNLQGACVPNYTFIEDSELVYINPFYYINKYYKKGLYGLKNINYRNEAPVFMKLGDSGKNLKAPGFSSIDAPDVDFISHGQLLYRQLKYIFIGHKVSSNETFLYAFDFLTKKFQLIDSNVQSFFTAPNNTKIAYVKKTSGEKPEKKLITAGIDGKKEKELKTFQEISAVAWSADGEWIAFSGGEKSKNDLYIIKSDGTSEEQLTEGMNPTGNIAWSETGAEIAFSSSSNDLAGIQTVFIIKMNMKTGAAVESPIQDYETKDMANKLIDIIRMETNEITNAKIIQ
jgi:hypothetical protein